MSNKINSIIAITLTVLVSTPIQAGNSIGYWFDSSNEIVRTGFGECWRTIYWSESNAIAECEGGMARKVVKEITAVDNDNDGVIDSKDQCKNTVDGAEVDSKGCVMDTDNDGIANADDECAGTAAGTIVNTHGCELKADISLDNVQFKTGTAELSSDSRDVLDDVAAVLLENNHLKFDVAGHTDNTGNYQNNVNLSSSRANSVKQYLVDKGVNSSRLSAHGYGPDKPVASNDTSGGRKMNRRVELVLQ